MTSEDMEMELEAYLATHANAAAGDYGLTVAVERFSCAKSLEKVLSSHH